MENLNEADGFVVALAHSIAGSISSRKAYEHRTIGTDDPLKACQKGGSWKVTWSFSMSSGVQDDGHYNNAGWERKRKANSCSRWKLTRLPVPSRKQDRLNSIIMDPSNVLGILVSLPKAARSFSKQVFFAKNEQTGLAFPEPILSGSGSGGEQSGEHSGSLSLNWVFSLSSFLFPAEKVASVDRITG